MLHWINCIWGWNSAMIRQLNVYQRPVSSSRLSEIDPRWFPELSATPSQRTLREQ